MFTVLLCSLYRYGKAHVWLHPCVLARAQLPAQDAEALTKLVGRTSGVLYESPLLQIGVKVAPPSASQPTSQCRMIFYYGNKCVLD